MKRERINSPIFMRVMVNIVQVIQLRHRLPWQVQCLEDSKI